MAKEEIDNLFAPKVLTNYKRYVEKAGQVDLTGQEICFKVETHNNNHITPSIEINKTPSIRSEVKKAVFSTETRTIPLPTIYL